MQFKEQIKKLLHCEFLVAKWTAPMVNSDINFIPDALLWLRPPIHCYSLVTQPPKV